MKRRKSILWITDPWESLDHPSDTTLRLMEEAAKLRLVQSWCNVRSIRLENKKVIFDAIPILAVSADRSKDCVLWGKSKIKTVSDFSQIHYRTDPPVDQAYLHPLLLLKIGSQTAPHTEFVNPLEVLLERNEKLQSALIPNLMPPSLISSQWESLARFGKKENVTVLKPLQTAQSKGIELLYWETSSDLQRSKAKLRTTTSNFRHPILLQRYLPQIQTGEVRLWFLDGKLLSCAKKLPLKNDYRVNIDQGSQVISHILTASEKRKVTLISQLLQKDKIRLAAIDLIGGFITDFNITSPGLIVQMEKMTQKNLARTLISQLMISRLATGPILGQK